MHYELLILIPRLDIQIVNAITQECADEGGGEAGVCEEWDVEVDGHTADYVILVHLRLGEVFGHVDYEVKLVLLDHFGDVGLAVVVGPMHHSGLHAVFVEEIGRAACAPRVQ